MSRPAERARAGAWGVSLALVLAVIAAAPEARPAPRAVLVFAASSMQTAIDALTPVIEARTGIRVRTSYGASSALARQIESGAPADLFISADLDWMDYLEARELVRRESRVALVRNRLVLVAPAGRPVALRIQPGFPIAAALGDGRLAVADPDAVPAGKYARAALTSLGVWISVSGRLAAAENVRAALLLVARGEAPLGIVYASDARAEPDVRVVDTFPEDSHPPIVYPAALTKDASPDAARVLAFLTGPDARRVFDAEGFVTDRRPGF